MINYDYAKAKAKAKAYKLPFSTIHVTCLAIKSRWLHEASENHESLSSRNKENHLTSIAM